MSFRRRALTGISAAVLLLGVTGCGEEGPVDDGTFSALQAGAPAVLDDLGVTLVSLDAPAAATPSDVADALAAEDLDALAYSERAITGLAVDPDRLGGLVGVAGTPSLGSDVQPRRGRGDDTGTYVVFAFDQVDAAVFFAQSDQEVFADPDLEAARTTYFSGNLVGHYSPGDTDGAGGAADERFRAALDALAGV